MKYINTFKKQLLLAGIIIMLSMSIFSRPDSRMLHPGFEGFFAKHASAKANYSFSHQVFQDQSHAGIIFLGKSVSVIDSFPYVEDVEHGGGDPPGWRFTSSQGNFSWQVHSSGTPTANTGPDGDHTGKSGYYLYTEASNGSTGEQAMLVSPQLDFSSLNNPKVNFWYHMYGSDIDTLAIDIAIGGIWINNFEVISGEQHNSSTDSWTMHTVDLSSYANSDSLRFRAIRGNGSQGDIAIDDIAIGEDIKVNLGPDTAICQGTSITLNAGSNPQNTYQWYVNNMNTVVSTNPSITTDSAATYYVKVSGEGYFTGKDSITLSIDQSPGVNLTAQSGPDYCHDGVVDTLIGFPAGGFFSGPGVTANTFNPASAGTGTHSLHYSFTNSNGCQGFDSLSVTVHPKPLVDAGSDTSICPGGSVTLTATSNTPASFVWSNNANTNSITVSPATDKTYIVTATDNMGCSNIDSVQVSLLPWPDMDMGGDTLYTCAGDTATLYPGDFETYNWSTGETTDSIMIDSSGIGLGYKTITVNVTDSFGCTNSAAVILAFVDYPSTTIMGPDTLLYSENAIYDAGKGFIKYQWSTGDSTRHISLDSTKVTPGTESIYVTITDEYGCRFTATKTIYVDNNTGINEIADKIELSLYPNPSKGIFTLEVNGFNSGFHLHLLNINGQLISSEYINKSPFNKQYDLSNMAPGVYYIRIVNDKAAKIRKLILH
ncbi:MAG: T9SS type A sorting domain-containing protein [Bacteroidales bacterium]